MNIEKRYLVSLDKHPNSKTIIASLSLELYGGQVSPATYELEDLQSNSEVRTYEKAGIIKILTKKEVDEFRSSRNSEPVSTVIDVPHPSQSNPVRSPYDFSDANIPREQAILSKIEGLLSELKGLMTDKVNESDPMTDNPIPESAPVGMPMSDGCKLIVEKPKIEKMTFINKCKDLGLLRELIMFDPDKSIKKLCKKKVAELEKEIHNATAR